MTGDVLSARSGREEGVLRISAPGVVDLEVIVRAAGELAVSCRAVMDGLVIVIGRVILAVFDGPPVICSLAAGDLDTLEIRVDSPVIVVVERGVGSMAVILAERVVVWPDVVGVKRLSTMTGRVMRVVLDELMVRFELAVGDWRVVDVEGLLTLTDPGVVLGLMVTVRFVDEEFDDFGVGEAGWEIPRLLDGARLGDDMVGERLGADLVGARLGVVAAGVRLGALLVEEGLGAVRLGVLLLEDTLEFVLPYDREVDAVVPLDVLRVDTGEAVEVDGVLAAGWGVVPATGLVSVALSAGFGVDIGVGLEAACGVSLTIGLDAAGFGVALTTGLETAGSGVDLTGGLGAAGFGVDSTAGLGAVALGGALTAGLGAAFDAGLDAAFGAGSGLAWGAGLGAASGAGLGAGACLGAAFAWGAAGLAGLLLGSSAKAGATQVITAKANAISRTFASYCNLMIDMIGLLSSLSGFFTCQDSQIQGCRSIYKRRCFDRR